MNDSVNPTRRDFLSGGAALRAAQAAAQTAADAGLAAGAGAEGTFLLQVGRDAMACHFEVLLNAGRPPDGPDAALRALDLVDALEDQLSVYRPHSEVSRLNLRAGDGPWPVEPRLWELLAQAVTLWRDTDGAFDITAGPLSKVWGFYRRAGRLPSDEEIQAALRRVGSQHLELDEERRSVHFRCPGLEINLGAIGKGYTLDRCAELLLAAGVNDFLIHGGTSSILARGSRTDPRPDRNGWSVALRHPLRPETRLAELWLRGRALGTSGAGNQFFFHGGRRYGHILDPRTGRPAEKVLSSTVIAPTAALADALSTAFYVGGAETAERYCAAHPDIATLLVVSGARAGEIEVRPLNLTESDWSPAAENPDQVS